MKYDVYMLEKPKLTNYFGDEFDMINVELDSKYKIRKYYNAKIREISFLQKNERKINRSLFKKIKVVNKGNEKSEKKRIKNEFNFQLLEVAETAEFAKINPNFETYLQRLLLKNKDKLKENKKSGSKQAREIAKAADEVDVKKVTIDTLSKRNKKLNEALLSEIRSIVNFLENKKSDAFITKAKKHFTNKTEKSKDALKQLQQEKLIAKEGSAKEVSKLKADIHHKIDNVKRENGVINNQFQKQMEYLNEEKKERLRKTAYKFKVVNYIGLFLLICKITIMNVFNPKNWNKKDWKKKAWKPVIKSEKARVKKLIAGMHKNNTTGKAKKRKYYLNPINYVMLYAGMIKILFTTLPFSVKQIANYYLRLAVFNQKQHDINDGFTYGAHLAYKKAEFQIKGAKEIQEIFNAHKKESRSFLKTLKSKEKRAEFKTLFKEIRAKYKAKKKAEYAANLKNLKSKKLNISAFLKNRKEIRVVNGNSKRNELFKKGHNAKAFNWYRLWREMRYNVRHVVKETQGSIENQVKLTPVQTKFNVRWVMAFLNTVLPGMAYLVNKQWWKAAWTFLATGIIFGIFLAYGFGMYNYNGNGVLGLKDLGGGQMFKDSRFFLIEGATALICLVVAFTYAIMMGYSGYKQGMLMERGIRPNVWFMSKKEISQHGFPYLMSLPSFFFVVFTTIMPIFATLLMSFTNYGYMHNPTKGEYFSWVGFENYDRLFSSELGIVTDFFNIIKWTLVWTLATTFTTLFIGFGLALMMNNERMKFTKFFRLVNIIPWVVPGFVFILLFKVLLKAPTSINATDAGPLYDFFCDIGFWDRVHMVNGLPRVNVMLEHVGTVKLLLIAIQVWLGVAGTQVFYSGMLKGIPKNLYEAAKIDGAKGRQQLFRITMPLLLIAVSPLIIRDLIGNFNNFGVIWLFADGGPTDHLHPSVLAHGQTDIVLSWIYKLVQTPGAIKNAMGISSAAIIVLSIISVTIAFPSMARTKAFKEEY